MKKSLAFTTAFFLIGSLFLSSCNNNTPLGTAEDSLTAKTWTVTAVTGPTDAFVFSGSTTIDFSKVDETRNFTVTGGANLPRVVVNGEQVEFPASGTWALTENADGTAVTGGTLTGADATVSVSISVLDDVSFGFSYDAAEPKATDTGSAVVSAE